MFLSAVEADKILQDPCLADLDPQMVRLLEWELYDWFSVNNGIQNTWEENTMRFAAARDTWLLNYIVLLQNQVEQLEVQVRSHLSV